MYESQTLPVYTHKTEFLCCCFFINWTVRWTDIQLYHD